MYDQNKQYLGITEETQETLKVYEILKGLGWNRKYVQEGAGLDFEDFSMAAWIWDGKSTYTIRLLATVADGPSVVPVIQDFTFTTDDWFVSRRLENTIAVLIIKAAAEQAWINQKRKEAANGNK